MSTAINNYSLSNASMINAGSAGSDPRKKFSFDDLLLFPSVAAPNSTSKNYLCYSARASPVLPPIARDADIQRKYNTAPASPNHHDYLSSTVTPQTSPLYARARLAASAARLPDACPVNQQESLPSLRHLQLLPNPRIQESACYYPDTSEHTPIWKRTLVHWCKEKNYQDYTKIVHEISHDRTQLAALLRASNSSPKAGGIPSVLRPKDAFQGLSDYAHDKSTPMTPPMSPLDELAKDQQPEFTPFVSSKLVQTVKQQSTSSGPKRRHKKTNSFKAMQLKKMFNSRDVLASDSQTNATNYKVSKRSSVSAGSSGSSSSDDSARLKKLEISDAARNLVISLGAHARRPTSPVRSSESIASSITTPTKVSKPADSRSRSSSRSHSPVRPATPPHTATSSSYHRFAYDSPQSPVATLRQGPSGNIKTTPKRRRSSGSSTHGVPRKCVSCHSNDSPCWRPSWSGRKQDQLCNSCGLRYKKTHTRCLNEACRKIPTKSELGIMRSNGLLEEQNADGTVTRGYRCLFCDSIAETTDATLHHHA